MFVVQVEVPYIVKHVVAAVDHLGPGSRKQQHVVSPVVMHARY
jgi:hypothetical protein